MNALTSPTRLRSRTRSMSRSGSRGTRSPSPRG